MRPFRSILVVLLIVPLLASAQVQTRERGIGPFTLQTRNGPSTVRLLRLDRDMLWADQRTSDGRYIEIGIPRAQIVTFEIPRLPVIERARQAITTQQVAEVEAPLKAVVDQLRPYRDLPGMPVYDAMLIQARMLMLQKRDAEALTLLNDLNNNAKDPAIKDESKLRTGLILARQGDNERALNILENMPFPDEDPDLLDDLYAARAKALAAVGRHKEALMDFYFPVVFMPHIQRAEPRSLLAALPSLAAIPDWASVARAMSVLRTEYANEPETAKAEEWAQQYKQQLGEEQAYVAPGQ